VLDAAINKPDETKPSSRENRLFMELDAVRPVRSGLGAGL
jgi:hypothetical protein